MLGLVTCVLLTGGHRDHRPRPTLSGPERVADSADGLFRVHYTLQGGDAVPEAGGATPDYVKRIIDGLEIGRDAYRDRGYRKLVRDDGLGGSDAIDVYVRDIPANGFAFALRDEGRDGKSCRMEIDNGLVASDARIVESVSAHELHHCIQYTYTADSAKWLYEATATYEQYRTVPSEVLEVAVGYLWDSRLSQAHRPMDDFDGDYEYAGFVWLQFWDLFGGREEGRLPALWEALAQDPDWRQTMDAEAQRLWNVDLTQAFLEYATWNAFTCGNNDNQHYVDADLPCYLRDDWLPWSVPFDELDDQGHWILDNTEVTHTAAYLELEAFGDTDPFAVRCGDSADGSVLAVNVVAFDAAGHAGEARSARARDGDLTIRLTEALDPEGGVRIIAVSTGDAPVYGRCGFTRVDPVETATDKGGCGCSAGGSGTAWWVLPLVPLLRRRRSRAHQQ